jgi:collagen type VI alpha
VCSACSDLRADIVFLLDSSVSVTPPHFAEEKNLVVSFVNNLDIGPTNARLSVVTFSTEAKKHFDLDDYHSKPDLENAINQVPYSAGSTNTALGIMHVLQVHLA